MVTRESQQQEVDQLVLGLLMRWKYVALAFVFAVLGIASTAAQEVPPLTLVQSILLPGIEGRFDHFAIDLKRNVIVLPDEEAGNDAGKVTGKVTLVDLKKGVVIKTIDGFVMPHAIHCRPETHEFVVSDDDGTYKVLDEETYRLKKTEHMTLNYADGIRFDPATQYLYIVNVRKSSQNPEDESYLAIVDTKTWNHIGDIPFKGSHVEGVAIEYSGSRIFVLSGSRREIGVLDRVKRIQIGAWPLPVPGIAYSQVMDEPNHRLFVAVRDPSPPPPAGQPQSSRLVVLDTDTGKMVASLPTPAGVDDIFYDAGRKRIYISAGARSDPEGYVTVYHQTDADHYEQVAQLSIGSACGTSLFVPQLNRYYVLAQRQPGREAELRVYRVNP
jgi:DNA-binding beta-propeller fold protein YncE